MAACVTYCATYSCRDNLRVFSKGFKKFFLSALFFAILMEFWGELTLHPPKPWILSPRSRHSADLQGQGRRKRHYPHIIAPIRLLLRGVRKVKAKEGDLPCPFSILPDVSPVRNTFFRHSLPLFEQELIYESG